MARHLRPPAAYGGLRHAGALPSAVTYQGKIASNPCEGIKGLYANDRAENIWTDEDIAQLRAVESAEVMHAVDLAAETGLRTAYLFRLSWSHVHDDAIVILTSKSRFTREAVIPLHDQLKALLRHTPKRSPVILTNSRGKPWTNLNSSLRPLMTQAKLDTRDLHFHDLRGTAATRFYLADLSERVIAEIMGWEEETVSKIIRRYVGRKAPLQSTILQKQEARSGTAGVKLAVKPQEDDAS